MIPYGKLCRMNWKNCRLCQQVSLFVPYPPYPELLAPELLQFAPDVMLSPLPAPKLLWQPRELVFMIDCAFITKSEQTTNAVLVRMLLSSITALDSLSRITEKYGSSHEMFGLEVKFVVAWNCIV